MKNIKIGTLNILEAAVARQTSNPSKYNVVGRNNITIRSVNLVEGNTRLI